MEKVYGRLGMTEDELNEIRRHNAKLQGRELGYEGPSRLWKVEIDGTTAAVPTEIDKRIEQRRELALKARKERLEQNSAGWGVEETMAEIVRRQNGR
jgi:hypothetical protein